MIYNASLSVLGIASLRRTIAFIFQSAARKCPKQNFLKSVIIVVIMAEKAMEGVHCQNKKQSNDYLGSITLGCHFILNSVLICLQKKLKKQKKLARASLCF
jgi:hypothetical protein